MIHSLRSLTIAVLAAEPSGAAEPAKLSYTRDVQPILAANCFLCHGPDAGKRAGLCASTWPPMR